MPPTRSVEPSRDEQPHDRQPDAVGTRGMPRREQPVRLVAEERLPHEFDRRGAIELVEQDQVREAVDVGRPSAYSAKHLDGALGLGTKRSLDRRVVLGRRTGCG